MDFQLSAAQAEVVEHARGLAATFAARASVYDEQAAFPAENFAELRAHGLLAMTVPPEYGGMGLWMDRQYLTYYLILEAVAYGCSSTAQLLQVHSHATGIISGMGTPAQHACYLPQVVTEGKLMVSCGSETTVGTIDVGFYDTTLKGVEGGYLLNGTKSFASLAPAADYYLVWALMEGTTRLADGLVFAVVPKGTPGVVLDNDWDTMGMRATVSWSLHFHDCFVPADAVVGKPGEWVWGDPRTFTLGFCANHLGTAEAVFDGILDYIKPRLTLAQDAVIGTTIGQLDAALYGAKMALYHAAWLWETAEPTTAELASMKALQLAKQAALSVTSKAFELCGARSTFKRYPFERAFRDIRTYTLHARDDKMLQMLAQADLGGPFHSKQRYATR
jgi:alkylation response protein AidB-like acyl-CoA dehydrogenase